MANLLEIEIVKNDMLQSHIEYTGHYHDPKRHKVEIYCELVTNLHSAGETRGNRNMVVDNTTPVPVFDTKGYPLIVGTTRKLVGYEHKADLQEDGTYKEVIDINKPLYVDEPVQQTIGEYDKVIWEIWDKRNKASVPVETILTEGILRRMGVKDEEGKPLYELKFVATPEWLEIYGA